MSSFEDFLKKLSLSAKKRGKQFEISCKWFLENDRRYSSLIEKVWLWEDWPDRWGRDCGIDLIAKGRDGKTWAIQAKCYDPNYHITKKDIDSFLSESTNDKIDIRLLIASTDNIGRNARSVIVRQNVNHPVLMVLRQDLITADLIWPADIGQLISGHQPRQHEYKPRPHQEEAIQEVSSKLGKRGQLIMACGTGKTLTALWIAEKLKAHRVLVLVPSLLLLSKTLQEWVNKSSEPFQFLPVCSDETVARGADDIMSSASELAFPSTTDPNEIATFLSQQGTMVVFSTYQSSPRIAEGFKHHDIPSFDLIVADEAHRCAGKISSEYATVLDEEAIPSEKRLFMTATPRVYMPHIMKRAADSGVDVASMDDESTFGLVHHHLTFGKAINRGLLSDYQVVIIGIDKPTYQHLVSNRRLVETDTGIKSDAQTLASHVGLAKSIAQYDLRRVITFHSRVNWAKKFASELSEVIAWMPDDARPKGSISSGFVSGEMPTGDRNKYLNALRDVSAGERYILANARCLSEGVDVPTLDGIAFIDPKKSEIDIVQAVGRAIRLSVDKTVGTILIPVFIDDSDDPELVLSNSEFNKVWKVVNALRAHDKQLGEQLDNLRTEIGRKGSAGRPEKIIFDLPTKIDNRFVSAFNTRLVEATTASWNFWFGLLEFYAEENGHTKIDQYFKTDDGFSLGRWVGTQRDKKDRLTPERKARLESLPGWIWDVFAFQWEEGFSQLKAFVAREGHARVPRGYKSADGYLLDRWVARQRKKREKISPDRKARLEALPSWVWDMLTYQWEEGFSQLKVFVDREGHSKVPSGFKTLDGFSLGSWVRSQRDKKDQLTPDRKDRLEALPGWIWSVLGFQWEEGFAHLKAFVDQEGHARVPQRFKTEDGFKLGSWVSDRRKNKDQLTPERKAQLEALNGWVWDLYTYYWEEGFAHLEEFVTREDHPRVPRGYKTADDFNLGSWVSDKKKNKDQLTPERKAQLEALNSWVWDTLGDQWERAFAYLEAFVEREGHARVPSGLMTEDDFNLGSWVVSQRVKKNQLTHERKARFEALPGWIWNTYEYQWSKGFAYLEAFVEREGHARVPQGFMTEDGYKLSNWLSNQKSKKDRLTEEQITKLESLPGWFWRKTK